MTCMNTANNVKKSCLAREHIQERNHTTVKCVTADVQCQENQVHENPNRTETIQLSNVRTLTGEKPYNCQMCDYS